MDYNLIKKLVKIVEQSEITEFSVQEGDLKIKISKNGRKQIVNTVVEQQSNEHRYATQPAQVSISGSENKIVEETKSSNLHEVLSPIVGTFYRSPSPDSASYVQVGDAVSEGSILCIVEAMKLMNEIECEVSGKIVKILVENATAVEYNQPLFLIEKS
ncbi:MAG: acetyl-CoA carboxylase biotin carboxyl carrier protein [Bacteroidetes bacterium]|nr:acetyl-CoA carboxylase biotin carboxyl carrier protein [Bacteroidota bacterium]MBU1115484.1 acetyl-CoA carboxylase biotin carboxyl carrier protein [Bacteroidota bacterium]MBU1798161.1 acetyl-CoA carboxylase biotin carboxyl carrier protein [Bacteroidota bacterium]